MAEPGTGVVGGLAGEVGPEAAPAGDRGTKAGGPTVAVTAVDERPGAGSQERAAPPAGPRRLFIEQLTGPLQRCWGVVRARPLQVLLLVAPVVIYVVGAWVHRFITEDGYINFHIVQQINAGNGPNFNPGERVEAFTSPLYIVVLTVARSLLGWVIPLENLAVILGLSFSVAALVLSMDASVRLARLIGPLGLRRRAEQESGAEGASRGEPKRGELVLIPAGALVFACTPPMWRWATSGLETSLSFVWISLCFWGTVRRFARARLLGEELPGPDRPRWLIVLIGLGPLVRPEYAVYVACFLGGVWVCSTPSWRERARSIAWALGIPVAYQIFRMGYYATLIPNTALAKNSDASQWARGAKYAGEFLGRERLWIALAATLVLLTLVLARAIWADTRGVALVVAPIAGAVLNVLYVQRVGGDYMYARWYVPAWVALLGPVSVIGLVRPRRGERPSSVTFAVASLAIVTAAAWSVLALAHGKILDANTGLEFGDYGMLLPGATNPVNPKDYGFSYASIEDLFRRWDKDDNLLWDGTDQTHPVVPLRPGQGVVIKSGAIGASSYVAGPDLWIVDDRGLADVMGARLENNELLPIPGHEKLLSWDYVVARWAPAREDDSETVRAARHAFGCGDVKELAAATTEPMSVSRFFENLANAKKFTSLRIPGEAAEFEARFCGH